jgi:oligoendopeptidase F
MFAEFELKAHAMAEERRAVTVGAIRTCIVPLNELYYDGAHVDDNICAGVDAHSEFYNAFYVYQYATGFARR